MPRTDLGVGGSSTQHPMLCRLLLKMFGSSFLGYSLNLDLEWSKLNSWGTLWNSKPGWLKLQGCIYFVIISSVSYLVHMGELADAYSEPHMQQTPQHSCSLITVMPRLYPAASRHQLNGKALGILSTWLKSRSSKAGLKLMFHVPGGKDGSAFYLLYMHKHSALVQIHPGDSLCSEGHCFDLFYPRGPGETGRSA